jgi:hypothetical protein
MALRKGLPAKLALTDADDTRYDFRNLVVCNSDGTPRGGVTSPVGVNLLSSTATMNVSVAAFNAVAVRDSGAILLANDGPVNVTLTPAPASNSRIDVIYAKQNDGSSTVTSPDANNTPIIDRVTGTASATPVKPSIPTGAVELGTVVVPAGATATNSAGVVITTTCPFTAAPGGKVPFRTLSDLQAWTTATVRQQASVISDSTTSNIGEYVWSGTAWVPIFTTTWTAVPLSSFWASYNSSTWGTFSYRVVGGRVELRGIVQASSGAGTTIGTLPAGARPPFSVEMFVDRSGAWSAVTLGTNGALVTNVAPGNGTTYAFGDQSFSID